jgi:ABC-type bacteriocin/lantibiotic exporter with double-glycine peptidase domain
VKAGKSGGRPAHNGEVENIRSISFRRVSFSHKDNPVLKNLSLRIVSGDFAGISGLSGKGKTTIVNLLLGFLKPDSGRIFVNEKPAGETERQVNWKRIAYVKQQPFLLHDTILNNITLDKDQYDECRLREAVRVSGLDELIRKFPEGLDKVIAEQGKNLSGGQRQRIAIARALYKDADLIILDEPFNELDQLTEKRMLEHFSLLSERGKIIILITHHKESFSFCTQLILLNEQGLYTP